MKAKSFLVRSIYSFFGLVFSISIKAQTSGPSTPEVQTFTPHGVTELVNPFTGDFTYNIPLLDIGGYPVNITYQSGISMHDESSFVGLGWNLSPGVINRNVRGLPDDFNGEAITKLYKIREDKTIGFNTGPSYEYLGLGTDNIASVGGGFNIGISHNNTRGWDYELGFSAGVSVAGKTGAGKLSGSLGIDYGIGTREGAFLSPNAGLSQTKEFSDKASKLGLSVGTRITSLEGMKKINFGLKYKLSGGSGRKIDYGVKYPLSFVNPTYTPTFEMPMVTRSMTGDFKVGGEVYGNAIGGHINGYFSEQKLKSNREEMPSVGYMYLHARQEGTVLQDYNREKDGPYMKEDPFLGPANLTYDVYSVSGQGFSGQFRPVRNDVGLVFDPARYSSSDEVNIGGEAGFGNLTHFGTDVVVNETENKTGKWTKGNPLVNYLQYRDKNEGNPLHEILHFKNIGELTLMQDEDHFNRFGGFEPVYAKVNEDGEASDHLVDKNGNEYHFNAEEQNMRKQRALRNTLFSFLTGDEAQHYGLEKSIRYYSEMGVELSQPRVYTDGREGHHISEITITREDGVRYIYGIPVYNKSKKEVSFSIGVESFQTSEGLPNPVNNRISYASGVDNSLANEKGNTNYFSSVNTPPYAYAYLLTAILSPDYIDLTGDGPSEDDFGTYTHFTYARVHTNYKWRTPYGNTLANYNTGKYSDIRDDMANYVYGEKEIWYIHNIQTKNYIAEFSISDREDAVGVRGENGGRGNQRLKKLDKIALFTKAEKIKSGDQAVPLKTVHFGYDYSLCPGIENGTAGKLTLKEIAFSYQNAQKERLSPYQFNYSEENPSFNHAHNDRWGNYKPESPDITNERFPYSTQDKTAADRNASAWQLEEIKLPSGGEMNISYESDDYAYVQDKIATQMFKIIGFSPNRDNRESIREMLYSNRTYNYLYFKTNRILENDDDLKPYFKDLEYLYFNCKLDLWGDEYRGGGSAPKERYEEVQGFIKIEAERQMSVIPGTDTAWIEIGSALSPNPIAKAGWQILRKTHSDVLYPAADFSDYEEIADFAVKFFDKISLITSMIEEFDSKMVNENRAKNIDVSQSFIRLNNPQLRKLGGGSRVKKITLSDNWDKMTNGSMPAFTYGQEYEYVEEIAIGEEETMEISSGVAAYEPLIGGDENPHTLPVYYSSSRVLAPDLVYYKTLPMGESFFPAPAVGYSKVRIKNIGHAQVDRNATGYSEHRFYTAKDFPTKTKYTRKEHKSDKSSPFNPFYKKKTAATSQGFYVELNDMHGKPKSEMIFNESGDLISGTEFFYKTNPQADNELDNKVKVVNAETGVLEDRLLGIEYDVVGDAREMTSKTTSPGVQFNTDGFLVYILPIYIPVPFPEYSESFRRYRGLTFTKVVQRSGILEKALTYQGQSQITAKNRVFDGVTGRVLVTETENEFGESYYNTVIPAHWVKEEMALASDNIHARFNNFRIVSRNNGEIPSEIAPHLFHGDELYMESFIAGNNDFGAFGPTRAWVLQNGGRKWIIGEDGQVILNDNQHFHMKILRSGRKNMAAFPMSTVATKSYPFDENGKLHFKKIIDANAKAYGDQWQSYGAFQVEQPENECQCREISHTENTGSAQIVSPVKNTLRNVFQQLFRSGELQREEVDIGDRLNTLFNQYLNGKTTLSSRVDGAQISVRLENPATGEACQIILEREDGSLIGQEVISMIFGEPTLLENDLFKCEGASQFKLPATICHTHGTRDNPCEEVKFIVYSECIPVTTCELAYPPAQINCDVNGGSIVNPFILGLKGNWRVKENYSFHTQRTNSGLLNEQGFFEKFHNFYQPRLFNILPDANPSAWQRSESAYVIDPLGNVLESRDALDRPSSLKYGYGLNLPVAKATNAHYYQIAFDGFEDDNFTNQIDNPFTDCPVDTRIPFDLQNSVINTGQAHSGKHSLQVNTKSSAIIRISSVCDPELITPSAEAYKVQNCDLISPFNPVPSEYHERKYSISIWVKETKNFIGLSLEAARITIDFFGNGHSSQVSFKPEGPVIEGWRQINGTFSIPGENGPSPTMMSLSLDAGGQIAYFDDLRIQPFNSNMESYVYDPATLRLMAVLDAQNYATFYEYDQEGILTRTKKETERGVQTIQEIRTSKPKTKIHGF